MPRTKVTLDKVKEIYVGDKGEAQRRVHHAGFRGHSPRNDNSSYSPRKS
jgi:hypothetical protein